MERYNMFSDCKTEMEKNAYKFGGKMRREFEQINKCKDFEFYKKQCLGSYNEVFSAICQKIKICYSGERFVYFIDPQYLYDTLRGYRFENLTVDYSKILSGGLEQLKYPESEKTNQFCDDYNQTIDAMIELAKRIYDECQDYGHREYFINMIACESKSMEEAMQRILFVNQLLWQMNHRLVGIGRLDVLLADFYAKDIENKSLNQQEAIELIKDFLKTLHKFYWLKSNVLMGDTGQIIILGGLQAQREYFCNELTGLFIDAVAQLQLPDPKILLRVSKYMPRKLMERALQCIKTGVGSPLLSNDDVIIPSLLGYGVLEEDAYQYGTSACWEPLIPGKSTSLNNLAYLSYPKVLRNVIEHTPQNRLKTKAEFESAYISELKLEVKKIMLSLSNFRLQYNPLLSVFTDDCYQKKQDVSVAGGRYNNGGITSVGLSNAVNAMLNIFDLVYERKEYTIAQIRDILNNNFEGQADLQSRLKNATKYYGKDDEEILNLVRSITEAVTAETKEYRNYMGGGLKYGVSAPSYVDAAKNFPATFDGRNKGEPFGVHISSEKNNGYTEIVSFAAQLDYDENRFNGNVVDFMVTTDFISKNFEKFVEFLMCSIEVGFFQLQMNVVHSKTLIAAKKEPDKYPNLIVRVWGFSAYFAELPSEYQDLLIERALSNERNSSIYM